MKNLPQSKIFYFWICPCDSRPLSYIYTMVMSEINCSRGVLCIFLSGDPFRDVLRGLQNQYLTSADRFLTKNLNVFKKTHV